MGLRTHIEGARARVMASVELAVEAVPFGIIEAAAHLTVLAHSRGLAGEQTGRPCAVVRLQTQSVVRVSRGQLLKPVGKLAALYHSALAIGRYPKAKNRHEQLARIARLFAQLMRSRISFARRIGYETFGREEREAAGQLQFDLAAVALPPFGERRQDRDTALEMADRFQMG
jgi:hypothetical protein